MPIALNALSLSTKLIRKAHEHKGHGGRVILIGGEHGMVGAIVLSAIASLYCGAGWVEIGFLDKAHPSLIPEHPELMLHDANEVDLSKANAIAIGPGLGKSLFANEILKKVLLNSKPCVIDADALNLISEDAELLQLLRSRSSPSVITPHPGEAAKLLHTTTSEVQSSREEALSKLIELTQAIVVLKGAGTLLGSPNHQSEICHAGNSGMGSGGMGDTLTGILAALISQGQMHDLSPWDATRLGVELHAQAADNLVKHNTGPIGLTASEVAMEVRKMLNKP